MTAELAKLPRVDQLLDSPPLRALGLRREVLRSLVRAKLDAVREAVRGGAALMERDAIVSSLVEQVGAWRSPAPRRVINASGVLLHTNLGRAPLSDRAIEQMCEAAGSCDLEYDLRSGVRGSRFDAMHEVLEHVLQVPAAHVVNNGAAALMLACRALARGASGSHSVVLARTQMVEIGDSFRVASMIESGGCRVHEVGATNRVHLRDYELAIEEGAAAILWVHASNFELQGFVKQPGLGELATLAAARKVPLIADLGSGSLGGQVLAGEPTVVDYLAQGAQLVTFSGDKLLGGPQAGILAGEVDLLHQCRRHPMARALRPDKTTLAALRATLVQHASSGEAQVPLHQILERDPALTRQWAEQALEQLGSERWSLRESTATVGGGSLPGDARPSVALVYGGADANKLARRLRLGRPALVGRLHEGELWLDFASLREGEAAEVLAILSSV
jgi:L-seryl-tRNA(Ser) seleniumtransferase